MNAIMYLIIEWIIFSISTTTFLIIFLGIASWSNPFNVFKDKYFTRGLIALNLLFLIGLAIMRIKQ